MSARSELNLSGLVGTLLVCSALLFLAPKDWDAEYHRLNLRVEQGFSEPKGDPAQLEPYLRWMETKAKDRDEVMALLEEAKALSQQNPADELLKMWVSRFSDLLNRAQASGENTANGAVLRFMRVQDPKFPKHSNWQEVIWKLQYYGHEILLKAEETGFVTPDIRTAAQCMVNFCIRDVEGNPHGFGVYEGREGTFNIPPERDFDVDCEPRSSFTYTSRGEPSKPTDLGLDWIDQIRVEARWWKFSAEENDATELMEEFYEDSMCKVPPNDCGKGHRHYRELAEKYSLPRGIEYNEGFYATIYGKVEIVSSSGRKPAKGADVTVKAPLDGETWTGQTDGEGKYEINKVLLHKECMPFEITARHGQDEVWDAFYGPLEKPDPSYRYEKNLEIGKGDLLGQISVSIYCVDDEDSNPRISRTTSFTIVGTWKYQPKESDGIIECYRPEPLKAFYSYSEKAEDPSPSEGCPALDWFLVASSSISLPVWPMFDITLHPMGRLVIRTNIPILGSHYEIFCPGTEKPITVSGKKRAGSYPPSHSLGPPYCTDYEFYSRVINVGRFGIRGLLGPNGEMSGAESWTSCGLSYVRDKIGFEIDYVQSQLAGRQVEFKPKKSEGDCHSGTTNIQVQWNFKKIRK